MESNTSVGCCMPRCSTTGGAANFTRVLGLKNAKSGSPIVGFDQNQQLFLCSKHLMSSLSSIITTLPPESVYTPTYMFELADRDSVPSTFGDWDQLIDRDDFIINLHFLTKNCRVKLRHHLGTWCYTEYTAYVLFFIIDASDIPGVHFSVKIDKDLKITISLDGRLMDPADLTYILPITRVLSRWSQLDALLAYYGSRQPISGVNVVHLKE